MHENFDLAIDLVAGEYRGRVISSPAGEVNNAPLTELARVVRERSLRNLLTPETGAGVAQLEAAGIELFQAVFSGPVGSAFSRSLDLAEGQGLRLRLRLDTATDRQGIPWEIMYSPDLDRFLCVSEQTPVCRYTELPRTVSPLRTELPLRALAVVAAPRDLAAIHVDTEWRQIDQALENLINEKICALDRLGQARLDRLDEAIATGEYHLLHIACHGDFDRESDEPVVYFEAADGSSTSVTARDLALVTGSVKSLRLVLLNSCLGAAPTEHNVVSMARAIVRSGPAAVIAMQAKISDLAAITFSNSFYSAVASGLPVDVAVARARRRVYLEVSKTQWAVPTLLLRAPDGRLFDLPENVSAPTEGRPVRKAGAGVRGGTPSAEGSSVSSGAVQRILLPLRTHFALTFVLAFAIALIAFRPIVLSIHESMAAGRNYPRLSLFGLKYYFSPVELASFVLIAMLIIIAQRALDLRAMLGWAVGFAVGMSVTMLTIPSALTHLTVKVPDTFAGWTLGLLAVCGSIYVARRANRFLRRRLRRQKRR